MTQRQLNVRIDEGEFEVLEAAAYVDDENPPDVVRALLKTHVEELERDPEVIDALRAKRARKGRKAAKRKQSVSSLDERRKRSGGGNGA